MATMRWLLFVLSSLLFAMGFVSGALQLDPTYQTSKHIAFVCFVPGSSHITWVLRFLDELASRGHNVTFVTVDQNAKYGADYNRINTVTIDIPDNDMSKIMAQIDSHPDFVSILPMMIEKMTRTWGYGFDGVMDFIENNKVDTFICDHRTDACIDAVYAKKLPMILTATLGMFADASTSYTNNHLLTLSEYTTKDQTLSRRFYNKFLLPLSVLYRAKPVLSDLAALKRSRGLTGESSEEKGKHALKIISSLFGVETPRPVGPLIELVGPLMAKTYPGLDPEFDHYLATHQRVAYVAFGQHAVPDAFDVERVLTALAIQYEKGHIDGIIWSSRYAQPDRFATKLTTPLRHYDLTGCFGTDEKEQGLLRDLMVTRWSPQMAVLMHPSVSVFVSHGGSNSLFEALHVGKRMIFYPFFGDQPGTAKQLSQYGLSEYFDHKTDPALINERVEKVILDQEGTYQHHVERYQALIQIHGKAAPGRAADLVEEVAFANQGYGEAYLLPHREDVGHGIPWLKRHNLDIYGIALVMLGSTLGLFAWGLNRLRSAYGVAQKTKTL